MKEITISFTPEELVELAKQLYLGSYMTMKLPYDNMELADEIFNKVCAIGFLELPETGAFRHGGPTETLFSISLEMGIACIPFVDQFEASAVEEHVPYELADRDFEEKYGKLEVMEVLHNPALMKDLKAIQKKYIDEIQTYGVKNLRLVK